jgi:opacity protein-like surface antigen
MINVRAVALVGMMCLIVSAQARADVTGFIGVSPTPANRQVGGFAAGLGLLIVGFEFEYANTTDDPAAGAPSLNVGNGNVLLQTPFAIFGFQPYLTTGVGFYSETLGVHDDTGLAYNTGGGVKIPLAGPLRLRVDYRMFRLGSGALYSPAHRVYAGINLKF